MTPTGADLWFLPLGGCGEIGMNLNLYGHAGKWLMVDCGVTFETPEGERPNGDNEVHLPDPSFIADRSEDLLGLIATHVHQDHIGAIHYLWRHRRIGRLTPLALPLLAPTDSVKWSRTVVAVRVKHLFCR